MLKNIEYERVLWKKGARSIVGIDEVGRGPLAGPLVVCAVILNPKKVLRIDSEEHPKKTHHRNNDVLRGYDVYTQIKDSKQVSRIKRCRINEILLKEVIDYSIVEFSSIEIDKVGLGHLTEYAFYKALEKLSTVYDHVLTDSFSIKQIPKEKQTNIVGGDSLSITIGAASIMAKVYRDSLMPQMHNKYPQYGFDRHMGYGTFQHIEALKKFGPCKIHRRSYEPVKSLFRL